MASFTARAETGNTRIALRSGTRILIASRPTCRTSATIRNAGRTSVRTGVRTSIRTGVRTSICTGVRTSIRTGVRTRVIGTGVGTCIETSTALCVAGVAHRPGADGIASGSRTGIVASEPEVRARNREPCGGTAATEANVEIELVRRRSAGILGLR
jgi:hypothetical protein